MFVVKKYLYLHFCDSFVIDVPGQKDVLTQIYILYILSIIT